MERRLSATVGVDGHVHDKVFVTHDLNHSGLV